MDKKVMIQATTKLPRRAGRAVALLAHLRKGMPSNTKLVVVFLAEEW